MYATVFDDLTILQVNRTQEKPCALRKMFGKLDVRRKSIVTLALSQENREIVVRHFVSRATAGFFLQRHPQSKHMTQL